MFIIFPGSTNTIKNLNYLDINLMNDNNITNIYKREEKKLYEIKW
jgi:hypothetical protein